MHSRLEVPVRGTPQAPVGHEHGVLDVEHHGRRGGGATAQFSRRFGWGGRQLLLRGGCEMRSEKEGVGGSGAAVAARGSSGREKLSAVEVQFRRESPRREPEVPPTSSFGCGGVTGKPREEKKTVLSKVGEGAGQTNLARGGGSSTGWVEARTGGQVRANLARRGIVLSEVGRGQGLAWCWRRGRGAKGVVFRRRVGGAGKPGEKRNGPERRRDGLRVWGVAEGVRPRVACSGRAGPGRVTSAPRPAARSGPFPAPPEAAFPGVGRKSGARSLWCFQSGLAR